MALDTSVGLPWPRHDHRLDRALGVLLGAAVGDANPFRMGDSSGWGDGPLVAGERTLALVAAAEAVSRAGSATTDTTADAQAAYRGAGGQGLDGRWGAASPGGALGLVPTVVLAAMDAPEAMAELARSSAALADPGCRAGDAAVLWASAIRRSVLDGGLEGARRGLREGLEMIPRARQASWQSLLAARTGELPALGTLGAAWSAVSGTAVPALEPARGDFPCRHFHDALAVAARHPDPDVPAVAGALLGALWGASGIPLDWQRRLRAESAAGGQARALRLIALGALTLRHGQTDPDGWPLAPSMVHSASTQIPQGVPLSYDPDVVMANIPYVPTASGFDAVVSLCRVGPDDAPAGVGEDDRAMPWLVDSPGANANLHFVVEESARAVASFRREGKRVLVHCAYGRSRTPAVAARYAALRFGVDTTDALRATLAAVGGNMKNPEMARAATELGGRGR